MGDRTTETEESDRSSGCPLCSTHHPFRMPPAIVEAAIRGRVVVFAGAGISTESSTVYPNSFYSEMKYWLSSPAPDGSFPSVMSAAEAEIGRFRLIQEALERIRFAATFPSLRHIATRFHHELSTIAQIREVITTNWDQFFEEECGMIPIVVDGDYSFYNLPGRKVYKIHGSTSNVSTMILTSSDYARREAELRDSVIGGTLRHLLGTKIVLFVGYSLEDDDFRNVYGPLMDGMGQLRPIAYVVTPHEAPRAENLGLRHIKTDGTHFLHELKAHLVKAGHNLPDTVIERAYKFRSEVIECHHLTSEMSWREHPELVFSLSYQDGSIDAMGRMIGQFHTGEYSHIHEIKDMIDAYGHKLRKAVEKKRYWDAAYIEGYMDALMVPLCPEEALHDFVPYELFREEDYPTTAEVETEDEEVVSAEGGGISEEANGDQLEPEDLTENDGNDDQPGIDSDAILLLLDEDQILEELGNAKECLPEMYAEGKKLVDSLGDGLIPQHTAFIDGVDDPMPPPSVA